jgi:hypothetical protein
LGLEIFDVMSLVEDHIHPRHAPEDMLIGENQLVGGNAHMESVRRFPSMPPLLPLANVAIVRNDLETRQKFLELHLPVLEYTRWDNDEVRPPMAIT